MSAPLALTRALRRLRTATGQGTTQFLLANWELHERIAVISPNQTASALYTSMTRFIRGHAVAAKHANAPESAAEWLSTRLETHEQLVDAIVAGDVAAVRAAVERHAGERSGE